MLESWNDPLTEEEYAERKAALKAAFETIKKIKPDAALTYWQEFRFVFEGPFGYGCVLNTDIPALSAFFEDEADSEIRTILEHVQVPERLRQSYDDRWTKSRKLLQNYTDEFAKNLAARIGQERMESLLIRPRFDEFL